MWSGLTRARVLRVNVLRLQSLRSWSRFSDALRCTPSTASSSTDGGTIQWGRACNKWAGAWSGAKWDE
eukprot:7682684-Alexandrium_andersonii.AAC.1